VYVGAAADPSYWDHYWLDQADRVSYLTRIPDRSVILAKVREHLPKGSLVLEGGSGLAQQSRYLLELGFVPVALDYAASTIATVRRRIPEVRPVRGSVFGLPFRDRAFDGYLSLGVIEHYFDGFDRAAQEMARCLRPEGIPFLTFPHMSRLRRLKAVAGRYTAWPGSDTSPADFYQFALDDRRVRERFQSLGFSCVDAVRFLGATGLEHEVPVMRKVMNDTNRLSRKFRVLVDVTCRWFCSHCILLVLKKQSDS
jgi:SAM-dependent methyltransferase